MLQSPYIDEDFVLAEGRRARPDRRWSESMQYLFTGELYSAHLPDTMLLDVKKIRSGNLVTVDFGIWA